MSTLEIVTPNDLTLLSKSLENKIQELKDIVVKQNQSTQMKKHFLQKKKHQNY